MEQAAECNVFLHVLKGNRWVHSTLFIGGVPWRRKAESNLIYFLHLLSVHLTYLLWSLQVRSREECFNVGRLQLRIVCCFEIPLPDLWGALGYHCWDNKTGMLWKEEEASCAFSCCFSFRQPFKASHLPKPSLRYLQKLHWSLVWKLKCCREISTVEKLMEGWWVAGRVQGNTLVSGKFIWEEIEPFS